MKAGSGIKMSSKVLSVFLAVLMLFTMIPSGLLLSFAAETSQYEFTVTDDNDMPVVGALVTVTAEDREDQEKITDEEGKCLIDLISDGTVEYTYTITKAGYVTVSDVLDPEKTDAYVITEKTSAEAYGTVTDGEGNPRKNVEVIIKDKITDDVVITVATDENGEFIAQGLYSEDAYTCDVVLKGCKECKGNLSLDEANNIILKDKEKVELRFTDAVKTIKFGEAYRNTANSQAGKADSYSSSDTTIAKVDNEGNITCLKAGEVTITAVRNETADELEASAEYILTIEKAEQEELVWSVTDPSDIAWNEEFTNAVSGGNGDGEVSYEVTEGADIAEVDESGKLTATKPGKVTVTATKAASDSYNEITSSYTITFIKADQKPLVFENENPDDATYGDEFVNAASGGSAQNAVIKYESSNESVATVNNDGSLVLKGQGNVTITAKIEADELYNEVSASYTLKVLRKEQTDEFRFKNTSEGQSVVFGDTYTNIAEGGNGTGEITYASSDEKTAIVDEKSGEVTPLKAGKVTITATKAEDNQYKEKSTTYELEIERADQTVKFDITDIPTDLVYGTDFTNAATAKTKITYSSSDSNTIGVDENGKLIVKVAGKSSVTITATAAESEQYNSATASYTVFVAKASQTLVFEDGNEVTVDFNDNNNKYKINVTSKEAKDAPKIFAVTGGEDLLTAFDEDTGAFTITGAGTLEFVVTFGETDLYKMTTALFTLTVEPDDQKIEFEENEYILYSGEDFEGAEATEKGTLFGEGEITYTIKSDSEGIIKSLDSETGAVELTYRPGKATILATKAACDNYNAAKAEYTIIVNEWIPSDEYFAVEGEKNEDSNTWFISNISIKATEGYSLSFDREKSTADWKESLKDVVTEDTEKQTVSFYVKDNTTGYISKQYTVDVKKDSVVPSGTITVKSVSSWDKVLSFFGLGASESSAIIEIDADDTMSGVDAVEYFVDYDTVDVKTAGELDEVTSWKKYTADAAVDNNNKAVVYAKITDKAGNFVYVTTNGIIIDAAAPAASLTLPTTELVNGYYTGDVNIAVDVSDQSPSSGINKIAYEVYNGTEKTQSVTLFEFNNENPEEAELVTAWNSKTEDKYLTVDAALNNSDNIRVVLTVTDNSGNTTVKEETLKIAVLPPELTVEIENFDAPAATVDGIKYFTGSVKAVISVKGRSTIFNDDGITLSIEGGEYIWEKKWTQKSGSTPDETVHSTEVIFTADSMYSFSVEYTDELGVKANDYESEKFGIDLNNPTGTVTVGTSTWDKLISTLTFGLYSKERVQYSITADDSISGIKSVEYYVTDKTTALTEAELNAVTEWEAYTQPVTSEENEILTVYAKITDNVGKCIYVSSNGYIVDKVGPTVSVLPETEKQIYTEDVKLNISVADAAPYSGINKVTYRVVCDGVETLQETTLYSFEAKDPVYSEIKNSFEAIVTIDAEANNGNEVKVIVTATDNAGHKTESTTVYDIDTLEPSVEITFDNNTACNEKYFNADRTATVKITERKEHFSAENVVIVITAKDKDGNTLNGVEAIIGDWSAVDGTTVDSDVHSVKISFTEDANYTLSVSYTDDAGNENTAVDTKDSVAPFDFVVDKSAAEASVSVSTNKWAEFFENIGVEIFANTSAVFSAEYSDVISGIESVQYYKTEEIKDLTLAEIKAVSDWTDYTGEIEINPDDNTVIYLKVVNNAGLVTYVNTNGVIIEATLSSIEIIPETEPALNGIYTADVPLTVVAADDADKASGIKNISYWIECDGKVTQEGTLYTFNEKLPVKYNKLVFSKTITSSKNGIVVSADKNKGNKVEVFVEVTDNAGNVKTVSRELDVDNTPPEISVEIDGAAYKVSNNKGYFSTARTAVITVTERTAHFDPALVDINIVATDVNGTVIAGAQPVIGEWETTDITAEDKAAGKTVDDAQHKLTITFVEDANYSFAISMKDKGGLDNSVVDIGNSVTPYNFCVDKSKPTATVKVETSEWKEFLETITFGLYKNTSAEVVITAEDSVSDIESIKYYKETQSKVGLSLDDVMGIPENQWTDYNGAITVSPDEHFIIYAKVVNNSGLTEYFSSDGFITEDNAPAVQLEVLTTPADNGIFTGDVDVKISASETELYSGLKTVKYWVECDGVKTAEETLFSFSNNSPEYSELVEAKEYIVTIPADMNKGNVVNVFAVVTDNAGNRDRKEITLDIDNTAPAISVSLDGSAYKVVNNKGYFSTARTAVITVTERTTHFDPELVDINIVATDVNGTVIAGAQPVIGEWETTEITAEDKAAGKTVDDAQHKLTITFVEDANYSFAISMKDKGGLDNSVVDTGNSVTHYNFCVDKSSALATVFVDENKWNAFLGKITFGLYKNTAATVTATASDNVSGIESIEYFAVYKDFGNISSVDTLEELSAGKLKRYTGPINITDDSRFVYYFKVVNNTGVVKWINSNGFIMEDTGAEISFEILTDVASNGIYSADAVDVKVSVFDITEAMSKNVKENNRVHLPYSGLKSVTYEVVCVTPKGEKVTDSGVLLSFNDTRKNQVTDLISSVEDTIRIISADNKGDYVKLVIRAEDNAGNVTIEEQTMVIDNTAPVINISYSDIGDPFSTIGDRGYFSADERVATVVITERTAHFNKTLATKGIKIEAVDATGKKITAPEYEISEWVTSESQLSGATVDDATHTLTITYPAGANYKFDISYTDKAGNKATEIKTNNTITPYEFTVDNTNPVATVSFHGTVWSEIFNYLTFNLFRNSDSKVVLNVHDDTSPVEIKYIKTSSVKSYSSLNNVAESLWCDSNDGVLTVTYDESENNYEGKIEIPQDERLTVYFRITDAAGNRIFVRSDGIIVDETMSTIELTYEEKDIYNADIPVKLVVNDDVSLIAKGVYSGLKEVKYWIKADGVETQSETFTFPVNETAAYSDLTHHFEYDITVDSAKNNSCDVKLWVEVTDNAGNVTQKNVSFDVDVTAPVITVEYDNNDAYKTTDTHGYFDAARKATVTITERTAHFDAEKALAGIKITAKDANGNNVIEDIDAIISDFVTREGSTADTATHVLTIDYSADANYTFEISYTDEAGNKNTAVNTTNSVAPYSFTVDTVAPDAEIKVGKLGFWNQLLDKITFGLWTKNTVKVSASYSDVTSDIESVSYYKTATKKALTVEKLEKITDWTEYKRFNVEANEIFVVYLKVVDNSGNVTYISTDGIIVDDVAPVIEDVKPEITITPVQPVNDIYNSDVSFAVKVVDPKNGDTEAFSGLSKVTYQVLSLGKVTQEGTLYEFDVNAPVYPQLKESWESENAITVDKTLNNSNDVVVKVFAEDNSGNKSEAETSIKIDITAPVITVRFDNNDGDTAFGATAAFKANRTATIVVTERNFDEELVKIALKNAYGEVPVLSGWTKKTAKGNGDDTTHTAYLVFNKDGKYTFNIECTDKAGNKNENVDYGDSLSPKSFIIDKTDPVFSIVYDNNSAQNGKYFKATRTATIKIIERNFETSRVEIKLVATDNGAPVVLPKVSGWVNNGDEHTLTINFSADAHYTFDFDYADKAGNKIPEFEQQSFVVDTTLPSVSISNIVDETANNDEGNIGFVITATDTNFDVFNPVVYAVHKGDTTAEVVSLGHSSDIKNGKVYTVTNIEEDGIYRINCTVVDKAGNAYNSVILQNNEGATYVANRSGNDTLISFSVNRDGSVFELGDKYTETVVDNYYNQNITDNITIVEVNADVLHNQKVTLNGKELTEGSDYLVVTTGGGNSWMRYVYSIDKALFAEEGEYNVVVSSTDKAENNAFSDVKNAEISFIVDRTAPVVSVSGLESSGRYQTEVQEVTIIPTDDGGAISVLKVLLVDEEGNTITELINLSGEELEKALEENEGQIKFSINEGLYQNIRIICVDSSTDADGNFGTYDETFAEVSVSPQAILIFWASKSLRYGTIGGVTAVAALCIIIIVLKKKKNR